MDLLNWMSGNPILTVILALLLFGAISDIATAIGKGLAGKASDPKEPE